MQRLWDELGLGGMLCPEEHGGLGTPRPAAWIEARGALAGDVMTLGEEARIGWRTGTTGSTAKIALGSWKISG